MFMAREPRLLLFDAKPYDRCSFEAENDGRIPITCRTERLTLETVGYAEGYEVISTSVHDFITEPIIKALFDGGTRLIALRCAGYDTVDCAALQGRLRCVYVPCYSPHAIAEHAVGLLLSLNRKIHRSVVKTRSYDFTLDGLCGVDLYGKTAGIFGVGAIGTVMCAILKGFGMHVIAHDTSRERVAAAGATYVSRDELWRQSDVILIHCNLTCETEHIIDEDAIAQMKNTAFLINTARGKIIDSEALVAALKCGKFSGVGLDVYEHEVDYFYTSCVDVGVADDLLVRLLSFPRVIITPHQAFFTEEALANIARTTMKNVQAWFSDQPLEFELFAK